MNIQGIWDHNVGIMEKKMETTTILGLNSNSYNDIGIMEKKLRISRSQFPFHVPCSLPFDSPCEPLHYVLITHT